jgi:tetratricopeptide (TPR) repeat protein
VDRTREAGEGKHDEAIVALQKAVELSQGKSKEALSDLGFTYAVAGRREEALAIPNRLEGESAHYPRATILAGLGEHDGAIDALDRAVEAHSWFLVQLGVDPQFDSLREDPRFRQIKRKMLSSAR